MRKIVYLFIYRIPVPKFGGTFHYCPAEVEVTVPKKDSLGRRTRYTETKMMPCKQRFRKESTYRRHYRRVHSTT